VQQRAAEECGIDEWMRRRAPDEQTDATHKALSLWLLLTAAWGPRSLGHADQ
jgi:hypothetical protein